MPSFELKLFSLKQSKILKIESTKDVDENVAELLGNFSYQINEEERRITIESLQQNTQTLRDNISAFVDRYKQVVPQINQLSAFIRSLEDEEYFYIFPNTPLETIQIAELGNHLKALNQRLDVKETQEEFALFFGDMLSNYDMLAFNGESRANIGESNKSKVKCRFCGNDASKVNFKNKAHAISEALGNKGIVCNEECDTCNEKFGKGIETDLIALLSFYRAFFGIKGKGSGAPKLKGQNFAVKKEESGEVNFSIIAEDGGFPERVEAHTYDKVSQQNIYRALCKYVISVIPSEHITALNNCVKWINEEYSINRLPPIFMRVVNQLYSEYPSLSVYIRKNTDQNIPHLVGEFRFANIVLAFILPASDNDAISFVNESDLDKLWEMSHYSKSAPKSEWLMLRLNSDEKKELRFVVNFEKRV